MLGVACWRCVMRPASCVLCVSCVMRICYVVVQMYICDMYIIEGPASMVDIGIMNMDNIGVDYMINHGCVQMM